MARFKALLFDLGNTLIYFDGAWPEVFAQAQQELLGQLSEAGVSLDAPEFLKRFEGKLNDYYRERESEFIEHTTAYVLRTVLAEFGHTQVPEEALRASLKKMYAVSQAHWIPEEDCHAALDALKAKGYKMGILSNAGDDADVQTLVDKANLRSYFDFALSSAACGIRKPNPRIFQIALERLGVAPDEAAMIGDTLGADILGARNAGIFSIWITRRADSPGNRDHLDTITPDAKVKTLEELPALLARL